MDAQSKLPYEEIVIARKGSPPYNPTLEGDSDGYGLLYDACKEMSGWDATLEIGVRLGAGSQAMIAGNLASGLSGRVHYGMDDYAKERHEKMYIKMMAGIFTWCLESKGQFRFILGNLFPWLRRSHILNTYFSVVHFDFTTDERSIIDAIEGLKKTCLLGGIWIFDDVYDYDHCGEVEDILYDLGFDDWGLDGNKKAYIRKGWKRVVGDRKNVLIKI